MNGPLGIEPDPDAVGAVFWEGARAHELRLQRCRPNGHVWHPPSAVCPECRGQEYEWVQSNGRGTVHTWTTIHHPVHPAVADKVPYTVVLVDLDEGPRMVSLYRGEGDPVIGDTVTVRFEDYDEVTLPVFVTARADA
jgi:uncharacterized OB-fold protein